MMVFDTFECNPCECGGHPDCPDCNPSEPHPDDDDYLTEAKREATDEEINRSFDAYR